MAARKKPASRKQAPKKEESKVTVDVVTVEQQAVAMLLHSINIVGLRAASSIEHTANTLLEELHFDGDVSDLEKEDFLYRKTLISILDKKIVQYILPRMPLLGDLDADINGIVGAGGEDSEGGDRVSTKGQAAELYLYALSAQSLIDIASYVIVLMKEVHNNDAAKPLSRTEFEYRFNLIKILDKRGSGVSYEVRTEQIDKLKQQMKLKKG